MAQLLTRKVYGVGINDADYCVGRSVEGKRVWCPYYRAWTSMLTRCFCQKYHVRRPTYADCKVCDSWLKFSNFKRWMEKQDWQGKQLDKDLLGDGKLYSPKTCVFVSSRVNKFTNRSRLNCGVSWRKRDSNYEAKLSDRHLGCFDTQEEAHQAWRKAKKALCQELINIQTCPRTKRGLRKYMGEI